MVVLNEKRAESEKHDPLRTVISYQIPVFYHFPFESLCLAYAIGKLQALLTAC